MAELTISSHRRLINSFCKLRQEDIAMQRDMEAKLIDARDLEAKAAEIKLEVLTILNGFAVPTIDQLQGAYDYLQSVFGYDDDDDDDGTTKIDTDPRTNERE
jgi:hypothetical protein